MQQTQQSFALTASGGAFNLDFSQLFSRRARVHLPNHTRARLCSVFDPCKPPALPDRWLASRPSCACVKSRSDRGAEIDARQPPSSRLAHQSGRAQGTGWDILSCGQAPAPCCAKAGCKPVRRYRAVRSALRAMHGTRLFDLPDCRYVDRSVVCMGSCEHARSGKSGLTSGDSYTPTTSVCVTRRHLS